MKKVRTGTFALNAPFGLWSALFIIAPLIMVGYFAFTNADGQFCTESMQEIFTHRNHAGQLMYVQLFGRSMWYGAVATAISLVLAFPLAHFMAQTKASAQRMLMILIMVPMWMNFLIATDAWRFILDSLPWLRIADTPAAAILGMVYFFVPFMILPIYTVMNRMNVSLLEAAQDLGAGRLEVLRRVIVPLSMPGVVSGIIMVFVPSVSIFFVNDRLGNVMLIGDVIERLVFDQIHLGAALSLVLMVMVLVCMLVLNRFSSRERGAFVT